ncbi:tetratricopeptide repeat protein, partial [Francisella philomiragia]
MKTRDKSVILNLFQNLTTKTIIATALIGVSTTTFASLEDCYEAGARGQYAQAVEECKPYADKDIKALGLVGSSLGSEGHSAEALPYIERYISYYKSHSVDDKLTLALAYTGSGNAYYFGSAEPKYPKDTTKGIEYITKGAKLGSPIAQEQLGSIYGSDDGTVPKNFSMSYYWYELGRLNGGSSYSRQHPSPVHENFDDFMKQGPYCIAIGQDNVGQAYYKGIGIAQSDSKAVEWLEKAYATDPNLSVTTLDLAKMYYNTGDKDKAFEYAQKAI